ncbi:hypothetical protein Q5752_002270 [Cryptotrichosporon argae]
MLPFADIQVPVPGFGCMGFSQSFGPADDATSKATLKRALELGCTFWDTAVVYGKGHNEALLGEFFSENPGAREKVFVASKCGFECLDGGDGHVTNAPSHIEAYIEGSRARLGSYPDLYYLHRIDPDTPLEASIAALDGLRKAGKIKYIGISEPSAATLRKANAIAKIDALQIEYSPWETGHERNGLLDAARELGVAVVAFSPLGRGMLTGKFKSAADFTGGADDFRAKLPKYSGSNLDHNLALVRAFEAIAAAKGCSPGQLALAWVVANGAIPIPGTRHADRLEENWKGGQVVLSPNELGEIRKVIDDNQVKGERYGEPHLKMIGH